MKQKTSAKPSIRPIRRGVTRAAIPADSVPVEVCDAIALLADDAHLKGWCDRLTITLVESILVWNEILPSIYMKQVLQERLRPLGLGIANLVKVLPR